MILRIFKDGGNKVERIERLVKVINHSFGTGNNGMDIEIYVLNPDCTIDTKKMHLDRWDFYDVEA